MAAWKGATRINGLPSRCRPADLDQGYAIQDALPVGCGADALGDPRDALAWFVNHLSSRGKAIEPGEFVTTGICAGPVTVKPGQSVIVRFDGYGEVNLRLTGED